MSTGQCRSDPVRDPERQNQIRAQRTRRVYRFTAGRQVAVHNPLLSYEVAFMRAPDPLVRERVEALLQAAASAVVRGEYSDRPGYIYVFHDLADADNLVKIGRTRRTPTQRVAEWNRALATPGDSGRARNVVLLFAYKTLANEFAERIVKETLRCQHIPNRLALTSGDELTEFYRIDAILPLKIFLRQTLAYIDALITRALANR